MSRQKPKSHNRKGSPSGRQNQRVPRGKPAPQGNEDVIFGIHSVTEAISNPNRTIKLIKCTQNGAEKLGRSVSGPADVLIELVQRSELDAITGPDAVHQGVVAFAKHLKQPELEDLEMTGTFVILDQVTDPHNVGAIMRSCAAFAVTALIATARHSPESSSVLAKSASGAMEHVPFVKVTNLARAMETLRDKGVTLIGLDSEGPQDIANINADQPVAIVLGAEGKGLRRLTRENCDHLARLDVPGQIRSLNVSNAAALCLYALNSRSPK